MQYVLIGGAALVGLMVLVQVLRRTRANQIARLARWVVGGLFVAGTLLLLARGQVGLASLLGPVAFMILRFGRIGGFSFESTTPGADNESAVKSRYIAMTLDHASGAVEGRVIAGAFRGRNLIDLDEHETRRLLDEVAGDPDSLALLETWLDRNREGWREYFGVTGSGEPADDAPAADPDAEARAILGVGPDATPEEIHAAHHRLMKAVHPDQGGSTYLAARINAAKDRLLRQSTR